MRKSATYRLIPNAVIRSALFTVKKMPRQKRDIVDKQISCQNGYEIYYKGEELNQFDAQVFQACVYLMRKKELSPGNLVSFCKKELLYLINREGGGDDYEFLWESLLRMKRCELSITKGSNKYVGNLFSQICFTKTECKFEINKVFYGLLLCDDQTICQVEEKSKLRSQVAKWCLDFFRSHSVYLPLGVDYMHKLCGSTLRLNEFKRALKDGLEELVKSPQSPIKEYSFVGKNLVVSKHKDDKEFVVYDEFNPFL